MLVVRLFVGLLLLVNSVQIYAHAVVTQNSLTNTSIHVNQATQVELSFNSKIELGLSQIFLVSKGDKYRLLDISNGSKQGQVLVNIPAKQSFTR